MAHKHGVSKKIAARMGRIMEEGHKLSKQLPTVEARNEKELRDAKNNPTGRKSSNKGREKEVRIG